MLGKPAGADMAAGLVSGWSAVTKAHAIDLALVVSQPRKGGWFRWRRSVSWSVRGQTESDEDALAACLMRLIPGNRLNRIGRRIAPSLGAPAIFFPRYRRGIPVGRHRRGDATREKSQ